ncbi:MAG: hypothetical protein U0793_26440 [Gemmataceae bacterium]
MSRRDDYDDYDDRGRGRRDDYDDRGRGGYDAPRGGSRSGLTLALGIIHIIFGSLAVLLGICGFIGSAGASSTGVPGGALAMITSLGILAGGACALAGGIGTILCKMWGWIMGLVAAGLAGLMGILFLIRMIQAFSFSGIPGFGMVIAIILICFIMSAGYAVLVFLFSFNAKVRRDMR